MTKSVLLIGLKSSAVDFEKWPQLSVEKLDNAAASIVSDLTAAGYSARWCLTDADTAAARQQLEDDLKIQSPDIAVIGAGVRTDPDHLLLFEQLLNVILREAPNCRVAFNTLPFDTVEAVNRWA